LDPNNPFGPGPHGQKNEAKPTQSTSTNIFLQNSNLFKPAAPQDTPKDSISAGTIFPFASPAIDAAKTTKNPLLAESETKKDIPAKNYEFKMTSSVLPKDQAFGATNGASSGNIFGHRTKMETAPMDINTDKSSPDGQSAEKAVASPNTIFPNIEQSAFKTELFPSIPYPNNSTLFGGLAPTIGAQGNSIFSGSAIFPQTTSTSGYSIFSKKQDTPIGVNFGSSQGNTTAATDTPPVSTIFGQQIPNPNSQSTSLLNSSNPFLKKASNFTPLFSGTQTGGSSQPLPGLFGQKP